MENIARCKQNLGFPLKSTASLTLMFFTSSHKHKQLIPTWPRKHVNKLRSGRTINFISLLNYARGAFCLSTPFEASCVVLLCCVTVNPPSSDSIVFKQFVHFLCDCATRIVFAAGFLKCFVLRGSGKRRVKPPEYCPVSKSVFLHSLRGVWSPAAAEGVKSAVTGWSFGFIDHIYDGNDGRKRFFLVI